MESMGSDFSNSGSVMSKAELEEVRQKRGECKTCGQKCYKKKLFKMIPIDEHGKVLNGRCLHCRPLQPKDVAGDGGVTAAVSRPATRQDLERFERTRSQLHMTTSTRNLNGSGALNRTSTPRSTRSLSRSASGSQAPNSVASRSTGDSHSIGSAGSSSANGQTAGRRVLSFVQVPTTTPIDSSPAPKAQSKGQPSSFEANRHLKTSFSANEENQALPLPSPSRLPRDLSSTSGTDFANMRDNFVGPIPTSSMLPSPQLSSNARKTTQNGSVSRPLASTFDTCVGEATCGEASSAVGHSLPPTPDELQRAAMTILAAQKHGLYQEVFDASVLQGYQESQRHPKPVNDPTPAEHPSGMNSIENRLSVSDVDSAEGPMMADDGFTQEELSVPDRISSAVSVNSSSSYSQHPLDEYGDYFDSAERPVHGILNRGGAISMSPLGVRGVSGTSMGIRDRRTESFRTLSSMSSIEEELYPISGSGPSTLRRGGMDDVFEEAHESNLSFQSGAGSMYSSSLVASPTISRHVSRENSIRSLPVEPPFIDRIRNACQAYDELMLILKETGKSPGAAREVLQALASLKIGAEDYDRLVDMGAPFVIANVLRAHMDFWEVQVEGCGAIWNMSGTPRIQLAFVDAGVLEAIIMSMDRFIENQELQEMAIATLSRLGGDPQNAEIIVERGVIQRVVGAMEKHSGVASLRIKGCCAVTNLACHDSPLKQRIMALGAGHAVVASMVEHPDDFYLQETALKALRYLCASCEANKVELASMGGIDAVISAMQHHRDEAKVQEEGAWTLSTLAVNYDNNSAIGDCGGVDVIVRAIWVHSDNVKVQEYCCRALFTLTKDPHNVDIVLNVGGIAAVVNAMQGHTESTAIQEMGCSVLANIADTDEVRMRIVDEEALDAIVLAMVLHSNNVQVQERACYVLHCLAIRPNTKPMKAANVVELARAAAMKFPEHCGDLASRLISAINGINF